MQKASVCGKTAGGSQRRRERGSQVCVCVCMCVYGRADTDVLKHQGRFGEKEDELLMGLCLDPMILFIKQTKKKKKNSTDSLCCTRD